MSRKSTAICGRKPSTAPTPATMPSAMMACNCGLQARVQRPSMPAPKAMRLSRMNQLMNSVRLARPVSFMGALQKPCVRLPYTLPCFTPRLKKQSPSSAALARPSRQSMLVCSTPGRWGHTYSSRKGATMR